MRRLTPTMQDELLNNIHDQLYKVTYPVSGPGKMKLDGLQRIVANSYKGSLLDFRD